MTAQPTPVGRRTPPLSFFMLFVGAAIGRRVGLAMATSGAAVGLAHATSLAVFGGIGSAAGLFVSRGIDATFASGRARRAVKLAAGAVGLLIYGLVIAVVPG